jgi:hypothetical protein
MSDTEEPTVEQSIQKRRKPVTASEIVLGILGIVFIAAVVVVVIFVMNKISRDHAITSAQPVADTAITAFDKRDGNALYALGSPYFKAHNPAASLTKEAKSVEIATLKTPSIDQKVYVKAHDGNVVYFVYKYSALKVPFYVRVDVQQQNGHWYLTALNGDMDEGTLLTNN